MSYSYVSVEPGDMLKHVDHIGEEWHAYLSNAPEEISGSATGWCCHTCELVMVDYVCQGYLHCGELVDDEIVHARRCQEANRLF